MEVKETINETLEISLIFIDGIKRIRIKRLFCSGFIDTSSREVLPVD